MFNWATYRKAKGAAKLHCILDHDGYLPTFACISEGKPHDLKVAKHVIFPNFPFPAGSIVAIDLGYYDFKLFGTWCATGVYFVTRMKSNTVYEVVERYDLPKNRNVLKDERIRLTGFYSQQKCPYELRRLEVWNDERQDLDVFLTNNFALGSTTIAAIHKDRWQIETFFKALKQNLKVKTFVGTSPNALKIQLWTALIAMLMLKYIKMLSTFNWSLSNLIAMLRFNLFTYRDLLEWLNAPFGCLIEEPSTAQLELQLGQQ